MAEKEKTIIDLRMDEIFFYVFLTILTVVKGIGAYEGQKIFTVAILTALMAYAVHFLIKEHSRKSLILEIGGLLLAGATWKVSGEIGAFLNIAVLVGMYRISCRRVEKLLAGLWGSLFILQCFLTMSGLRKHQIFRIHKKLGMYIVRWSMGFTHPNVLHITYFIVVVLLLLALKSKIKSRKKYYIAAMAGNLLIFAYSLSLTGVCIVTLYLLLDALFYYKKQISKRGRIIVTGIIPLSALFAIAGPIVFSGKIFDFINRILSTRFYLSRFFLTTQQIGWFGTREFDVPDTSYTIDSSYVYNLLHYGIIWCICYICILTYAAWKAASDEKMDELAVIIACGISGVTEQYMANTSFKNVAIILAGAFLWDKFNNIKNGGGIVGFCKLSACRIHVNISGFVAFKKYLCESCRKYRKALIVLLFISWIVGSGIYIRCVQRPDAVYASIWYCDRKEGKEASHYYYRQDLEKENDFRGWILEDNDRLGRLYGFDGFTADFEYGRRAFGAGAAMMMLTMTAAALFFTWREVKHESSDAGELEGDIL